MVVFQSVSQLSGMAIQEWVCGKEALTLTKTSFIIYIEGFLRELGGRKKGFCYLKTFFFFF